jgi:hypothetical protein
VTYKIQCPRCPVCGARSTLVLDPEQAFCEDNECPALTWNPTKTRDENLDGVNFINLPEILK